MKDARFKALATLLILSTALPLIASAYEELHIGPQTDYSPEELQKREQERRERELAAQREQQQIDDELTRRGWPKSREGEVRKFFELQKKAAALRPKSGAGAALTIDRATPPVIRELSEKMAAEAAAAKPASDVSRVNESPQTFSGPKSNCWEVDAPPKAAMGFSRASEGDARDKAMAQTKGCTVVNEMFCTSGRDFDGVKDGKILKGDRFWDCRISYHCGETRKQCERKPAAASKQ